MVRESGIGEGIASELPATIVARLKSCGGRATIGHLIGSTGGRGCDALSQLANQGLIEVNHELDIVTLVIS